MTTPANRIFFTLLTVWFALLVSTNNHAAHSQTPAKPMLVLISVPGITAEDLGSPEMSAIRFIQQRAGVGWMVTRTAQATTSDVRRMHGAGYLTLGAGTRGSVGSVSSILIAKTMAEVRQVNRGMDHEIHPGLLGDILHSNGLTTAIRGCDDAEFTDRSAQLLIADSKDHIDSDGSAPQAKNFTRILEPYGLSYDLSDFGTVTLRNSVTIWVLGDIARADEYSRICVPEVARGHRRNALSRINRILQSCVADSKVVSSTRYILFSPCNSPALSNRLSPIMMWGPGIIAGSLTSGSTHTVGLVVNTDFLPTILSMLELPFPTGLIGRPIRSVQSDQNFVFQHHRWLNESKLQDTFGGLPSIQTVIVLLGIGCYQRKRRKDMATLAVILVSIPLALLALPLIAIETTLQAGFALAASLCAIAWISRYTAITIFTPSRIAILLAFMIVADLLTGQRLLPHAWMSYSVMEGARYYGIGNEYAGVMWPATLGLVVAVSWPIWIRISILSLVAWMIGSPYYGANAGCFLGFAVGISVAAALWARQDNLKRNIIVSAAIGLVGLVIMILIDSRRNFVDQSHMAHAITTQSNLWNIAWRKMQMNMHLLTHSPWSLAAASVLFGLWKFRKPELGQTSAFVTKTPHTLERQFPVRTWLIGTVGLLIFNDSGVVAAAQSLLVGVALIGYEYSQMCHTIAATSEITT